MAVVCRPMRTALMEMRRRRMSTAPPLITTATTCRRYTKSAANAVLLPRHRNPSRSFDAMPTLLRPRVIVYDGFCHLSHAGVKWVIEADKYKKIKFCCLQSKTADPYLKFSGLNRIDIYRRFLFVEGIGSYHQGAAACLKVLSYLPIPYSALRALMVIPTPLRDAAYAYVARRRYDWFGKNDECLVLKENDQLLERFVDAEELLACKDARSRKKTI